MDNALDGYAVEPNLSCNIDLDYPYQCSDKSRRQAGFLRSATTEGYDSDASRTFQDCLITTQSAYFDSDWGVSRGIWLDGEPNIVSISDEDMPGSAYSSTDFGNIDRGEKTEWSASEVGFPFPEQNLTMESTTAEHRRGRPPSKVLAKHRISKRAKRSQIRSVYPARDKRKTCVRCSISHKPVSRNH
jgi:hypothetical protein